MSAANGLDARWLVVAIAACGSPSPRPVPPAPPAPPSSAAATCASVRSRVEALYRAEAQQREPGRVDEYVSDNTTMIMNDCVKNEAKLAPCIAATPSVPAMEHDCVIPLDDEGTEGEVRP